MRCKHFLKYSMATVKDEVFSIYFKNINCPILRNAETLVHSCRVWEGEKTTAYLPTANNNVSNRSVQGTGRLGENGWGLWLSGSHQ